MLEALTMLEERRLVRELPEELDNSDMGDMQELRPDMEEIPESEWEWLWRGAPGGGDSGPASWPGHWGGEGPVSRLFFHQFDIDLSDRSRLRCSDCCLSVSGDPEL